MQKALVTTAVVVALVIGLGAIYHYFKDIRIPVSFGMVKKKKTFRKNIYCESISNVGTAGVLKVRIVIPCQDKAQFGDLSQKLPRIKSAFLTSIDRVEMAAWIQDRNFTAIKQTYLTILNRFSDRPIKEICFDKFNYF